MPNDGLNWELAKIPDFGRTAIAYADAGRKRRKEDELDDLYSRYAAGDETVINNIIARAPTDGAALRKDAREERAYRQRTEAYEAVKPKIAARDFKGAATDLAGVDPERAKQYWELYDNLSKDEQRITNAGHEAFGAAWPKIKALPKGDGSRQAAYDRTVAPYLRSAGATAEQINAGRQIVEDDDTGDFSYRMALGKDERKPIIVDGVAYDPVSRQPLFGPEKIEAVPMGSDLYRRPAVGAQPNPLSGGGPEYGRPPGLASGRYSPPQPASDRPPVSVRNNNPGNLRDNGDQWQGRTGADERGFVQFDSPENGRRALERNLQTYGAKHGLDTVEGIINRWAPPNENDTKSYAQFVAQRLGVEPGARLDMQNPQTLGALADAITVFEGGPQSGSRPGPSPQASAPPAAAPGGYELVRRGERPQAQLLSAAEVQAAGFLPGTVVQRRADGSLDAVQSPNNSASPRKAEADLRKEFEAKPDVKNYREVSSAFRQVKSLAKPNATPADDLALTYSFMRMLDPGSVVREGEFAMVGKTAGLPDQVVMALQRVDQGKGLTPDIRNRLVQAAGSVMTSRQSRYHELEGQFRSYATDYGINPDRVVSPEAPAGGAGRSASTQPAQTIKTPWGAATVRAK